MSTASDLRREAKGKKKATIVVAAERLDQDPWVGFSMAAYYPEGGGKQEGKEKLKFDEKQGPFELTFELEDNSKGLKLAFLPSFEEAMWVAVGIQCPPGGPGDGGGAIAPVRVESKRLVVNNANSVAETLTFALRFTGLPAPDNSTLYVYDPQIINGGGSNVVNE